MTADLAWQPSSSVTTPIMGRTCDGRYSHCRRVSFWVVRVVPLLSSGACAFAGRRQSGVGRLFWMARCTLLVWLRVIAWSICAAAGHTHRPMATTSADAMLGRDDMKTLLETMRRYMGLTWLLAALAGCAG